MINDHVCRLALSGEIPMRVGVVGAEVLPWEDCATQITWRHAMRLKFRSPESRGCGTSDRTPGLGETLEASWILLSKNPATGSAIPAPVR